MSEREVLPEGTLIDQRYRVLSHIGGGAMSHVYKVQHISLGTFHALKQQSLAVEGDKATAAAYLDAAGREAQFLTTLCHPRLPGVTELIRENGDVFLVMDYVEGCNLKTLLERSGDRPIDVKTVVDWGIQICDILTYLHYQNPPIIFRDIKPSNLIRGPDNQICLVDFGIARQVKKGASADTIVFGSPGYAPPEQYGQGQTDPRSDIHALGATLHHLLTCRDPSQAPFKWPSIRAVNAETPLVLEKLILKCVEIEPSKRPESAEAVGRSLRTILQMIEENERRAAENAADGGGMPQAPSGDMGKSLTAPPRATFIPATLSPPRAQVEEPARNRSTGSLFLTRNLPPHCQYLYAGLFVFAIFVVFGGAVFPFTNDLLAPNVLHLERPAAPPPDAAEKELQEYQAEQEQYEKAYARVNHARESYQKLTPLRYTLDAVVCLALVFGVVRPMRPTRMGMVLAIGGILGLICLTGATFLPQQPILFYTLAVLEALLLAPAAILFTIEERSL